MDRLAKEQGSAFDCLIIHDVDHLITDDRMIYSCEGSPRHLSVAISKYNYRLRRRLIENESKFDVQTPLLQVHRRRFRHHSRAIRNYQRLFECLLGLGRRRRRLLQSVSVKCFLTSSILIFFRLDSHNLTIRRPSRSLWRYRTIKHVRDKENPVNDCDLYRQK